jgi:dipeptidyl aminopeptidase/acylaminoacyl peptidase
VDGLDDGGHQFRNLETGIQNMNHIVRPVACALIAVSAAAFTGRVDRGDTARGFTIQQALSAPFPTELKAAPAKGRLAWVFNTQGRRSIWVAEPTSDGTYATRQLTNYSVDDGQDLVELAWSRDADSLAYVRGGDGEFSEKPYPNPAGIVAGVEQDIWVISLKGGEPRRLGEGHSPAVCPTGDSVAYILKGQVWLGELTGGDQPQQLIHARGTARSLSWSPDGRLLAFVSDHGDHSFIGLFSLATKSLSYVEPSTDRDSDPVWSPDGRKLAFLRTPSTPDSLLFGPKRTGPPWSIRVYQVDSQQSEPIFKASEGRGSVFREVVAQNQLLWGAGDRIIFPWEKDGWTHLYSVSAGGGTPTLVTPGEFEVEYVSLSQDRKTAVYSSNQDDIDRRHVWKVTVDGKSKEALTKGTAIETAPVVLSDNQTVAVLRSDARLPLRPAILAGAQGIRDLAPQAIPPDFPAAQMVTPQAVIFSAADGMEIHGQLFLPVTPSSARHPAVVFFHGGSRRQMLLGWHYMHYYSNAYAMNQFLASRGYIVLSVNYRSGIGYGLEFREALNYGATGASEYNDVQGAGIYLRSRGDVDPQRIGLWGGSYGGYLTALGLARSSDLFVAGVDLHGVHDWNTELENFVPSYDPKAHADAARVAWDSSPLASVKTWRSPVLLIHGDDDRNVPFAQTVALADALRKQGVDFEELIFPDEIHDFLLFRNWVAAYSAAASFFDRQLAASRASVAGHRG